MNRLLIAVVGAVTLTVELSATRLLGPFFGATNVVWTMVIGVLLAFLALGYWIGGRLADWRPHQRLLFQVSVLAAVASALIPFWGRLVLPLVASLQWPLMTAVSITVLVLFSIPVTLLGAVTPIAVKLAFRTVESAGQSTGRIYTWLTLGSIIGAVVPVLVALPTLGTTLVYVLAGSSLMVVAFWGLYRHTGAQIVFWLWAPVVCVALLVVTIL